MIRPWKYLEIDQLKLLRFKDLDFDIEESHIWDWICEFQTEIYERGIRLYPHFTVGTEWFVPDGSLGISVPYYLLHPKLTELHNNELGNVEGVSRKEFLKYLRHELGHIIDNAFHLRKLKSRQEIFGKSSKPYPKSYLADPANDNFVTHIEANYAQSHPDEDWAETFAVWLTYKKSTWNKKYAGTGALDKLKYMDEVMEEFVLRSRAPFGKRTCTYSVENSPMTLEKYYSTEKKRLGKRIKPYFAKEFSQTFSKSLEHKNNRIIKVHELINKNEKVIAKRIKRNLGRQSHEIEPLIEDLKKSAKDLYLTTSETKARIELLAMIDGKGHDFYKKGFHRTLM